MHSVQSYKKQLKLKSRQRQRSRRIHHAAVSFFNLPSSSSSSSSKASSILYHHTTDAKSVPKAFKVVHGIVVSNLSLVLLQKEYIEQFYFEKRNGGGGPEEPDIIRNKAIYTTAACKYYHPLKPLLRYGWLITEPRHNNRFIKLQHHSQVNYNVYCKQNPEFLARFAQEQQRQQKLHHYQLKRRRLKTRSRNR